MNPTTVFRQALTAQLAEDMGIAFVAGRLEGPIENRDLGGVYPVRDERYDEVIGVERCILAVRVFRRFDARAAGSVEQPWDPEPLEEMAGLLKATIKANQPIAGGPGLGPWWAELLGVDYDLVTQGFEATVLGWQPNPAV